MARLGELSYIEAAAGGSEIWGKVVLQDPRDQLNGCLGVPNELSVVNVIKRYAPALPRESHENGVS